MPVVSEKVHSIFRRIAGDRANVLRADHYPAQTNSLITQALETAAPNFDIVELDAIGFHLVNCNTDAAFIVALLLYPEEFTTEDIREGVEDCMLDSAHHCTEALRIWQKSPLNPTVKETEESQ